MLSSDFIRFGLLHKNPLLNAEMQRNALFFLFHERDINRMAHDLLENLPGFSKFVQLQPQGLFHNEHTMEGPWKYHFFRGWVVESFPLSQ